MAIKRFYFQLSALLLSIVTTLTPILSQAIDCELRLTFRNQEYSEKQDVYFGARRMLQPEDRAAAMLAIGAPSSEEINGILRISRLQEKYESSLKLMVRQTIAYLVSRTDWDGYQKAVFWDSMAVEIDKRMRQAELAPFSNFYHKGSDGSFMFQGEIGETVAFTSDGRIFKGRVESIAMKADWQAEYTDLKEIR